MGPASGPTQESTPDTRQPMTPESVVAEIHEDADKLLRDQTSLGDLKILARSIKELRYAFKLFGAYRQQRKVTVFGSARTQPDHGAYKTAVAFGKIMAQSDWFVITGAGGGIMEAGHVGAGQTHSMGINILLPFEQGTNHIIAGDEKLVHLKYFFTRKLLFVKEADAAVHFPGGFGTMDEAFEVLTLVQTGKREMIPLVFVDQPGGDYWKGWHSFVSKYLHDRHYLSDADKHLIKVTDDPAIAAREILGFYRVYHSMRFVGPELVLRIAERISDEKLDRLNSDFADILLEGTIHQIDNGLPQEKHDEDLFELPRLVMRFDRKQYGRLRQLIDEINSPD